MKETRLYFQFESLIEQFWNQIGHKNIFNFFSSLAEKANQERAELETMADQLRGLAVPGAADSVNLDNLFDFLADVPSQRGAPDGQPDAHQPTIAEIGDSMERLADDLHQEVSNNRISGYYPETGTSRVRLRLPPFVLFRRLLNEEWIFLIHY